MEPFAGGLASLLLLTIFVQSSHHVAVGTTIYGMPLWKVALTVHVICWIIQFIGHGVFERMYFKKLITIKLTYFSYIESY